MHQTILAPKAIAEICDELNYTRSHVANILRLNAKELRARQTRTGRWILPIDSVDRLKELVSQTSGRRYRLGEKGPNKSTQS